MSNRGVFLVNAAAFVPEAIRSMDTGQKCIEIDRVTDRQKQTERMEVVMPDKEYWFVNCIGAPLVAVILSFP